MKKIMMIIGIFVMTMMFGSVTIVNADPPRRLEEKAAINKARADQLERQSAIDRANAERLAEKARKEFEAAKRLEHKADKQQAIAERIDHNRRHWHLDRYGRHAYQEF
jgi:hypothetical protein